MLRGPARALRHVRPRGCLAAEGPAQEVPRSIGFVQGIGFQLGLFCGCLVALAIILANEAGKDGDESATNVATNFVILEQSFIASCVIAFSGVILLIALR